MAAGQRAGVPVATELSRQGARSPPDARCLPRTAAPKPCFFVRPQCGGARHRRTVAPSPSHRHRHRRGQALSPRHHVYSSRHSVVAVFIACVPQSHAIFWHHHVPPSHHSAAASPPRHHRHHSAAARPQRRHRHRRGQYRLSCTPRTRAFSPLHSVDVGFLAVRRSLLPFLPERKRFL